MGDIFQLKITLKGTKPPIWRRVQVDRFTTFEQLHYTIQIAMGWTNSHLHEFNIKGYRIAETNKELDKYFRDKLTDASTVTLDSLISNTKEKFTYVYDFGDNWHHEILVEKILARDTKIKYPICIAGKLNCPPEDCGGIGGFYELLDIIDDNQHPEREDMLEWLGEPYNAEYFDKDKINQRLSLLNNYINK